MPLATVTNHSPPRYVLLVGVALAACAVIYNAVLFSGPTNDDFMHLALARQVLGGEWPVRDFYDNGLALTYLLSIASERLVGYRLLSEAILIGLASGASVFLVFRMAWSFAGSLSAAFLSALLVLLAAPRGYSHPKLIVYAGAAALWWMYVRAPTPRRAIVLGAWAAVSFYWRSDHGLYVAGAIALAMVAAHGFSALAVRRCATAAVVALAGVAPFLLYAQVTVGLADYVRVGAGQALAEHATLSGSHRWPTWPIRTLSDVVQMKNATDFAPVMSLRWAEGVPDERRRQIFARYGLTPVGEEPGLTHVRLSSPGADVLRTLVNEPDVVDTAGIDRSTLTFGWETWGPMERLRFRYPWMRVHLFPGLDEFTRAGEATAALFFLIPGIALLLGLASWCRALTPGVSGRVLAAFALFCLIVDFGLLRTPYEVRAVDAVVLPAVLVGWFISAAFLVRVRLSRPGRWVLAGAAVVGVLLVTKTVAVAGEFSTRSGALLDALHPPQFDRPWHEIGERLFSSPPLRYWEGRRMSGSFRLAEYARACVPPHESILVLWFAPEIFYYADRLNAYRHVAFLPEAARVPGERQLIREKLARSAPPIALATPSRLAFARDAAPDLMEYVTREYEPAGTLHEGEEDYVIYARRDRPPVRSYGELGWPCYR